MSEVRTWNSENVPNAFTQSINGTVEIFYFITCPKTQFRFEQTRQPEWRPAGLRAWGRHRPSDRAGEEEEPYCRGGPGLPFAPTPRHLSDTGPLSANTLQLHRGLCLALHLCRCVVIVSVIFMSLFAHVAPPPSHKLEHQCWLAPISNRKLIGAELQRRVGLAFCRCLRHEEVLEAEVDGAAPFPPTPSRGCGLVACDELWPAHRR